MAMLAYVLLKDYPYSGGLDQVCQHSLPSSWRMQEFLSSKPDRILASVCGSSFRCVYNADRELSDSYDELVKYISRYHSKL